MPLDYIDGRYCHAHKIFNPWRPAEGGEFARCPFIDLDTHKLCSFFRCKGNPSPNPSPTIPAPPSNQAHFHPVALTPMPSKRTCSSHGCGKTQLADACGRRMCCQHCRALGGCNVKKHSLTMDTSHNSNISANQFLDFQFHDDEPSTASTPTASIPADSTSATACQEEPFHNPRYASHMTPLMAKQWSDAQLEREGIREKQQKEKDIKEREKKKHMLYVWTMQNGSNACIHSRQGNSDWPQLQLNNVLLKQLGFPESITDVDVFLADVDAWVMMLVDDYILLKVHDRIFLKETAMDPEECQDFERHFMGRQGRVEIVKKLTLLKQLGDVIELDSEGERVSEKVLGKRRATIELTPPPTQRSRGFRELSPVSPTSAYIESHPSPFSPPGSLPNSQSKQLQTIAQDPLLPLPPRFTASPSPTGSTIASEESGSPSSPIHLDSDDTDTSDNGTRKWPQSYFAVDIVPVLKALRTTRDHMDRWNSATTAARTAALAAGRTPEGLWMKTRIQPYNLRKAKDARVRGIRGTVTDGITVGRVITVNPKGGSGIQEDYEGENSKEVDDMPELIEALDE
ncbi:hypothetical protein C8J56DRAFT_1050890 [Mycena floridula]|nr:hypothetical protein C8J56DRAFT_1050890 [Mycena floridula]